jgi:DNA polymerase-3 subunit epsilon
VKEQTKNILLKREGRNANEKAFVLVKEGIYLGYGFVNNEIEISSIESLEAFLVPQKHTTETISIIKNVLKSELLTPNNPLSIQLN